LLDFRSLAGVEHVLDGEGVEIQPCREVLQHLDVAEPVDVDPGDFARLESPLEIGDARVCRFLEPVLVVAHHADDRRLSVTIGGVGYQRGR